MRLVKVGGRFWIFIVLLFLKNIFKRASSIDIVGSNPKKTAKTLRAHSMMPACVELGSPKTGLSSDRSDPNSRLLCVLVRITSRFGRSQLMVRSYSSYDSSFPRRRRSCSYAYPTLVSDQPPWGTVHHAQLYYLKG